MYAFDFGKPGTSRQSFYNNDAMSMYDYPPPRNPNIPNPSIHGPTAADRVRESRRGARQSFNSNYSNQNNTTFYPFSQWTPTILQHQRKQQSQQNLQKDKRRDFINQNRDKGNRPSQHSHQQSRKNKAVHGDDKHVSALTSKEIDYRLYKCPNCVLQFDFSSRYNSYIGRVPLILNCRHTVCQDCIGKLAKDCSVICPLCKNPSSIPPKCALEDLQDVFSPNFFLIGFIMWCKTQGSNPNFMTLVPVQTVKKTTTQVIGSLTTLQQTPTETCCFLSCNKSATLHCQECSDVYCPECCTVVHKSAKSLWSHKPEPLKVINKGSLELEKCAQHNMDLEFYCISCETTACIYCCVEKHECHTKDNLVTLNEEEMQEMYTNKDNAKKILKQLLISQRRLGDLYSCSTANIEKKISSFFVNYHAKLQFIEKNLKKELASYSTEGKPLTDVDDLNNKLTKSIETLSNAVIPCDSLEIKKMNLKELSKRLKAVQDIPCYLVSDNGKALEPLEFDIDPIANDLEEFFKIVKSENCDLRLVTEDNLPSDYEKDSLDQQYESDVESCMSSVSKPVSDDGKPKKKILSKQTTGSTILENELVDVTYIERVDSFYVQLKKTQYQFSQMNQDINDYIKMGAPTVENPRLGGWYLVLYQTNNEKFWARGRITEFKNGEKEPLYEIFFLDSGKSQTVDISKMRQITPSISQKKPFAIHCELYNPTNAIWNKNASEHMRKMLNGKQVTMVVKKIHSGVHEVDLMIMSSDRGQTSIVDLLIHTCSTPLNNNSSDSESVSSNTRLSFNTGHKIFGNSTSFQKFQRERVILVNVIDPHHIFVHIVAHSETLKKLYAAIKSRYKHSQRNSCLPVEGTYVIVDYKDPIRGNWHRGLVKKVDAAAEKCHVLLLDWGLHVVVPWANIRNIQEEFTRLESQAVLVKLAHVEPINKGAWLESAIGFLRKYYRSQEVMRMIVHNTDPLEVALFEINGDVDFCINASLVHEELAESSGTISQTLEWPRNDAKIQEFTEEDGLVASLLKKVETLGEDSDEEDKNVVKQKIEVVKFVSPDLIFIKFAFNESHEMNLHKELQIHYSNERETKSTWETDEVCVVLHNLSYARAKILEKISNNRYKVNIYDRAVDVVLPIDKIFEYKKYFNKFPNVVFKSYLANIRPAGGDKWSMSSCEALERMFDKYKDIYGTKVVGDTKGKTLPMHMWYAQVKMGGALEASKTNFISLNNLLVKLGFAYKVTPKTSKPSSVKSDKSTGSKTSDSKSSAFISVLDKLATNCNPTLSDQNTDQDSISDLETLETSISETKDVEKTDTSSVVTVDIPAMKMPKIDWNKLIEEEEKPIKEDTQKDEKSSPYHTQEAEITDWIPAFPIKERQFKAWVTCAETGGILYLREEKLQTVYKEMEQNIKEYFVNKPPREEKHVWEKGQMCTIHHSDDSYYRGKVYEVVTPDDITAVMIDFGSDHKVKAKDLNREILYPKIPAFASKVKLDRLYPKSGAWLDSDYEVLMDTITEYTKIIIKGSLDVPVPSAEVFTDKGVNVNETLVRLCPNLSRTPPAEEEGSDDDGIVIEEESVIEDEQLVVELLHEVGATVEETVEDCVPVDTTQLKYNVLELPDLGPSETFEVSVMFVVEYNKLAIKETKTITDEFYELGEQIQEGVKNQSNIKHVEVGMPCVCPFSEDGKWYRAQIYNVDGIDECGYVFVFFVDFGNVESVAVCDIKMIHPNWLKYPVSCHIVDLAIEMKSDKNIKHVTQHMKKLYGKNKMAKIFSREPLCVNLYESDGELCYESLLTKGLVESK